MRFWLLHLHLKRSSNSIKFNSSSLSQTPLENPFVAIPMNFFKSVFSTDTDSETSSTDDSPSASETPNPNPNSIWSTGGGFIKSLATRSESVFESYRKDFDEFRSGLKKETDVIREAASRAVKDLPASFEIGTTVAQESLESVGQAIDDIGITVWKSTAEIISQGRRNPVDNSDSDNINNNKTTNSSSSSNSRLSDVKKYSRFETQLNAIQCDYDTYCREPEDVKEFERWRLAFVVDDERRRRDIESLVSGNGVVAEIYGEIVCGTSKVVDEETFWSRYFYRVHKLKQAEEARVRLVKRAISVDEEEDLSWDFDDDDEEEGGEKEKSVEVEGEKVVVGVESCKDSDVSVVSSQRSMREEDMGWDEIEDIGSGGDDENKGEGSTSRVDLRRRLSAAEEHEDLSWDSEDDEEEEKEEDKRVKS